MRRLLPALLLGAAFTLPGGASAAEPPAASAEGTATKMAEAKRQFEAGISLLEDPEGPRYEEAHDAFKQSYVLSQNSKVLGNVALCAFYLERDGEAIDLYTTYLHEVANVDAHERAQIERDLATLRATVATVEIHVKGASGASTVLVDRRMQTRGNPVENTYAVSDDRLVVRMRPGRHTFVVRSADAESTPKDVEVQPATTTTHELELRPLARPDAAPVVIVRRSVAGPVVLGIGGLLAIGAGIGTGLAARSTTSDLEDRCPGDVCPRTYTNLASDRASAKTLATVADFSFVGGGVLLGGALLWYALLPSRAARASRTALLPGATCGGDGCRATLAGVF